MYNTAFLDIPALQSAHGTVTLPGSKSISNRVLLLAALCEGTTVLHDLLDSDDTRVMLNALRSMGCAVVVDGSTVRITGLGGLAPVDELDLFMGNAGTAMRPLTAALALMGTQARLHGVLQRGTSQRRSPLVWILAVALVAALGALGYLLSQ